MRKIGEEEVLRLINRGDLALLSQFLSKALKKYEEAVELAPSSAEAYFSLAEFFRFVGKWQNADKFYRYAINLSPKSFYKYRLALLLKDMGKFLESSLLLKEVVKEQPNEPYYHFALGEVFWEMGNMEGVLYHFGRAVELEPLDDFYHAWLGVAFASMEEWDNAERELKRAHQLKPESLAYVCILAEIYSLMGKEDLSQAFYKMAKRIGEYDNFLLQKFRRKILFNRTPSK
jgi:tetratricopeptide (TPR) repeat protein